MQKIIIIGISILSITVGSSAYYYFNVKTLMLSEIINNTGEPSITIIVNLFDFDTGLTRFDIHNLSSKCGYWNSRISEMISIRDQRMRQIENEKLLAEMMQDPSMKKIARKIFSLGNSAAGSIIKSFANFKLL